MLPHRFTNTKKKYNASFAQEKVYFYLKTKKKNPGFDMANVCYFGGFYYFLNLSEFCRTGGDKGKALPCASFSSQHLVVFELLNS